MRIAFPIVMLVVFACEARGEPTPLTGTAPLTMQGDLSARMVEGIDRYLTARTEQLSRDRSNRWQRDTSSAANYNKSLQPSRDRLRRIIGAVDTRLSPVDIEYVATTDQPHKIAESELATVHQIRWPVFADVSGEGLLLEPTGKLTANVILIPDADDSPEQWAGLAQKESLDSGLAQRLAAAGCRVIIPVLIDRSDRWSGNERLGLMTNQPHREWIYRQAFEMGRHIIGYEVAKLESLIDWGEATNPDLPIGLFGYGEGGMLALYLSALDPRIDATAISGYFGPRENLWREPIYRNLFGLLTDFGDAELALMTAPRPLYIEHAAAPPVAGPLSTPGRRATAAPGKIETPSPDEVRRELERSRNDAGVQRLNWKCESSLDRSRETVSVPGSTVAPWLLSVLGIEEVPLNDVVPTAIHRRIDADARQQRQVAELVEHTQGLMQLSEQVRSDYWNEADAGDLEKWKATSAVYRDRMWNDVIGRLPDPTTDLNPRSRFLKATPDWTAYEVVLDVWPEVFAWGYLLLPSDLEEGERRPVVVCQHGLEGLPEDTIATDPAAPGYGTYKGFAARLAERGFVVYAPHNPYRGQGKFRVLQRKANPLGASLFSVIVAQHSQLLRWLKQQSFVDPERIAFYGLSYGGEAAMRAPALLEDYCLSICSANFNDWIKKNVTVEDRYSYMFTGEYEMPEFNLGHTFNYAEMAALIAPRPFMVERGHHDGVAPDEWVAYEYAKVRRRYADLGISDLTEIEFFNGPHTINGIGTFSFLHRQLDRPEGDQHREHESSQAPPK